MCVIWEYIFQRSSTELLTLSIDENPRPWSHSELGLLWCSFVSIVSLDHYIQYLSNLVKSPSLKRWPLTFFGNSSQQDKSMHHDLRYRVFFSWVASFDIFLFVLEKSETATSVIQSFTMNLIRFRTRKVARSFVYNVIKDLTAIRLAFEAYTFYSLYWDT